MDIIKVLFFRFNLHYSKTDKSINRLWFQWCYSSLKAFSCVFVLSRCLSFIACCDKFRKRSVKSSWLWNAVRRCLKPDEGNWLGTESKKQKRRLPALGNSKKPLRKTRFENCFEISTNHFQGIRTRRLLLVAKVENGSDADHWLELLLGLFYYEFGSYLYSFALIGATSSGICGRSPMKLFSKTRSDFSPLFEHFFYNESLDSKCGWASSLDDFGVSRLEKFWCVISTLFLIGIL